MAGISEYDLYDFDTLTGVWDRGWQELRQLCDYLDFDRDKSNLVGGEECINALVGESTDALLYELTREVGIYGQVVNSRELLALALADG
jgi:hypothetical protein